MADPLSITASVIAVAGLAYSSSKALCEVILTTPDAPQTFQDLNQSIAALTKILNALKTNLEESWYEAVRKPDHGRRSFRDGIKLGFHNKSIADFRMRVVDWKESLALALDIALLTSMSANTEAINALEVKMAAAVVQITTDLKVVNTRLEKLLTSEPESEDDLQIMTQKREVEEQQKTALMQCLSLCQAAADGVTQTTDHSFKNNRVFGEARATYGNVGHVPASSTLHSYDGNSASGKGRVVMGNMDSASFLEFMK